MASLPKILTSFFLSIGLSSAQIPPTQGMNQNNDPCYQIPNWQQSSVQLSDWRYAYDFKIDNANADFFSRAFYARVCFYDARKESEKLRDYPMHPKTFEEVAEMLGWKNIFFEFLCFRDSLAYPRQETLQEARCNHFILSDENGNYYYPYMGIDYAPLDIPQIPVDLRNPPENEGIWAIFNRYMRNRVKSKSMEFGQSTSSVRVVPYLLSIKRVDPKTKKETEYRIDVNGEDFSQYFRIREHAVLGLVSDDGNDLPLGRLEDLVK